MLLLIGRVSKGDEDGLGEIGFHPVKGRPGGLGLLDGSLRVSKPSGVVIGQLRLKLVDLPFYSEDRRCRLLGNQSQVQADNLSHPQARIVLPKGEPVFGPRRQESIRFLEAAVDQIVTKNA